jgi:hypothetical protein
MTPDHKGHSIASQHKALVIPSPRLPLPGALRTRLDARLAAEVSRYPDVAV